MIISVILEMVEIWQNDKNMTIILRKMTEFFFYMCHLLFDVN